MGGRQGSWSANWSFKSYRSYIICFVTVQGGQSMDSRIKVYFALKFSNSTVHFWIRLLVMVAVSDGCPGFLKWKCREHTVHQLHSVDFDESAIYLSQWNLPYCDLLGLTNEQQHMGSTCGAEFRATSGSGLGNEWGLRYKSTTLHRETGQYQLGWVLPFGELCNYLSRSHHC